MAKTNPGFKNANEQSEFTSEQIVELQKCSQDVIYFVENYVKIRHPVRGAVNFTLFDYQKKMLNSFAYNRNTILLSARQSGKSIVSASFLLWFANFNFDKDVVVASNKNSNAMEMIRRIRFAYENLPNWLKAGIEPDGWNKHSIKFDNGSRIESFATTAETARGMSVSLMFIDEMAFVKPNIQEEFWTSISPTLSCIVGDTLLLTNKGYVRIEELCEDRNIGEYFEINNMNIWGRNGMEPISHGYVSPKSQTLKIKTRHGLELEVTEDHPLLTIKDDLPKMTKSIELKIGDPLRIDIGMNIFGNTDINEELGYLLGGYTAEGWCGRNKHGYHTIYISNCDDEFRNKYINSSIIKPFRETKHGICRLICCSKELVNKFIECGIDPSAKCFQKQIPDKILQSDKKTICSFLRGLFDGDGSVTDRSINLTSTSKKLIQQVQILLLNIGIVSNVFKNDAEQRLERERRNNRLMPGGKPLKSLRDSYSLNIPLSQYEKFLNEIGFELSRKRNRCISIINNRKQEDFKHFTIPLERIKDTLYGILDKFGRYGFRKNGIRLDKFYDDHKNRKVTLSILQKIKDLAIKENISLEQKELNFFNEYLSHKHFWDEIVSIERSTNKTYDLTVPGTHSFLQNGIIGSNTGGSCIISSTPNNSNDVFATLWQGAELNSNDFIPIRVHWTETPGRSDDFKQKEISKIGLEKWEREFELKFLSADDLLINPITLQNLTEKVKHIEPVKEIKGIKFWKVPDEKDNNITTFIVSVDPASGRGGDYCVFEVFTFPSLEQVAEYRTNDVPTTELYKILKLLLGFLEKHSANVYFSIESNAIGEGLIALYENDEESPEKSEFISGNRKTPGFYTTRKDKNRFCYTLKDMIESNKINIKSKILVSELKNFISSRGSYEARVGSTDDCISSVLIALRIMNEMTTYDDRAFDKIYGGLNVDHWTEKDMLTYNEEDDDILPIIGDGDEYASYKPLEFYH